MKTLLMPTDGSVTARAAARFAGDIAKAEGASVVVLSVVHPQVWGDMTAYGDVETLRAEAERIVEEQSKALRDQGIDARGEAVPGNSVPDAIESAAEKAGADLIVMGTHGHTGLARAVIGSVADRVLRHSKVPVLLVPLTHVREAEKQPAAAR